MQGMKFLLLNEQGKPFNHGEIVQRITAEKYLCHFTREPASARVCDLEEIQGWNLFPTDDAMNAFIAGLQKADAERIAKLPQAPGDRSGQSPTKEELAAATANKKKTKKKGAKKNPKKSPRRKANVKK